MTSDSQYGPRDLRLEDLTYQEIETALHNGFDTVIVPAGSIEQHGLHLPLGTDSYLAETLSVAVARLLGGTLVAPVVRPGCSDHHMAFSGTITLPPRLFMDLLMAYALSLYEHGFRSVVLLTAHGGNFAMMNAAAVEIRREKPRDTILAVVGSVDDFVRYHHLATDRFGIDRAVSGFHAALAETSEMLACRPDLVHMDRVEAGYLGPLPGLSISAQWLRAVSPHGLLGDARGASAEIGEAILASVAGYMAEESRRQIEAARKSAE